MEIPLQTGEVPDEAAGTDAALEAVGNILRLRVQQVSRDITERCQKVNPDDTTPEIPRLTDVPTSANG